MKKTIFILFFAIIFVQNMFAWGGALRDVTKQPSATPTFYLGDVATFAWATSSAQLVKIGVGILASPPAAYTNLTWNTPTDYTPSLGKMSNYTVTSVGTGYYSIWLGYSTAVGTNGSFFNGKNTTMTYGDNNNSSGGSTVPWNSTYCYGTFTVNAINDPTVTTPFTTTSSSVSLAWSKNTQSHNVMIVRKLSSDLWTEPTQGSAYTVGNTIGSGTIVYNGNETSYSDTNLNSGTSYDYKFYSVNNNYYSLGMSITAITNEDISTNVSLTPSTTLRIFTQNAKVQVIGLEGESSIIMYDLVGNVLDNKKTNNSTIVLSVPASGVYLLRIHDKNNDNLEVKILISE